MLSGKIDKDGILHIKRGMEDKKMRCAQSNLCHFKYCNDECPMFCTPLYPPNNKYDDCVTLKICLAILVFSTFYDERETEKGVW